MTEMLEAIQLDLQKIKDSDLFRLYNDLMEELQQRQLIRSTNNPVCDYSEKIVSDKLKLKLQRGSTKGYDAIDEKTGLKYQIKSRRLTKHNKSRQLGVIRNWDQKLFDYLIAVIFNEFFEPQEIWKIPHELISNYSKFSEHQNGHILILRGKILEDENVQLIS